MVYTTGISLAVGHIAGIQIDPWKGAFDG